jgi:hypothetical protein
MEHHTDRSVMRQTPRSKPEFWKLRPERRAAGPSLRSWAEATPVLPLQSIETAVLTWPDMGAAPCGRRERFLDSQEVGGCLSLDTTNPGRSRCHQP